MNFHDLPANCCGLFRREHFFLCDPSTVLQFVVWQMEPNLDPKVEGVVEPEEHLQTQLVGLLVGLKKALPQ